MARERRKTLVGLLESIEESLGWEFERDVFEDRLRMQKYVFFADAFGADVPYDYGIHLHGPYSPDLAEDYYAKEFDELRGTAASTPFDTERFASFLEGRSTDWLEYAATIKRLHERNADGANDIVVSVVTRTSELKDIDPDEVKEIYAELLERDVLP